MNQPKNDEYLIMVGGISGVIKTISPTQKSIIHEFKKASIFANEDLEDDQKEKSGLRTIRSIITTEDSIIVTRESDDIEFYTKEMQLEYELAGDISDTKDVAMVGKDRNMLLTVESAPYMRLFNCQSFFEKQNAAENDTASKPKHWRCQLISGGHSKDITAVSVFNAGRMVVSGGKDGRVCIWQVEDNSKLQLKLVASLDCENNMVRSLCADETGQYIYVNYSFDDTLAVLTFNDGKLTRQCVFIKPHSNLISSIDANGSLVVTGSKDKTAKLWTYLPKTKEICNKGVLKGHSRGICSVKFSQLEQLLLTTSMDKTIKLWSLEDFSCVSVSYFRFPFV